MVRGVPSSIALLLLGSAAASTPPQQQACEALGADGCSVAAAAAAEANDFGHGLSLLMTGGSAARARDHSTVAGTAPAAEGGNGTAKCNEQKFQGLCYRTCTDMGQMEPRKSPSNCGGVEDYSFIQRCKEDGTSIGGAGSAPGIYGRPTMGCFGDTSASLPSPDAPNMCTTDCKKGAPSSKANGCNSKWCCADGKSLPQAVVVDKELICSCSLGIKPPFPWLPEAMGVFKTTAKKSCNTGCDSAKSWLMDNGIAYCCPGNKKPTVLKSGVGPDYTVECSCP